jgi:hypothetical protein
MKKGELRIIIEEDEEEAKVSKDLKSPFSNFDSICQQFEINFLLQNQTNKSAVKLGYNKLGYKRTLGYKELLFKSTWYPN